MNFMITYKHINDSFKYDGSQIESSWAFKSFKIKGSSILTWRGSMDIKENNLKDFEDIGLEIKSDDMIHFMIEHFDCQPANIRIAYLRQRLLVMILKEELAKKGVISTREGDDIYIGPKKLTVSIATASISSMKIHLAINLTSEGTPDDVDTIGLFEINLNNNNYNCGSENNNDYNYGNEIEIHFNEDNLLNLINDVVNSYINELKDIEFDISKTNLL